MSLTKICKWCGKEKEYSEFYSQKKYSSEKGNWIYYHPECKQCTMENAVKWRQKPENREKWLEVNKNKNRQPKYKKMMKEASKKQKENGYYKNYQQQNKDKFNKYGKERRMNKEHNISDQEWFECLDFFKSSCAYCGITEGEAFELYGQLLHKEHIEHYGVNDITNCVPACKGCNSQKWEYELNEWYNENNQIYSKRRYDKIIKWILSFSKDRVFK